MKVSYLVEIINPEQHLVKVTLKMKELTGSHCEVFLPSWSPGSYCPSYSHVNGHRCEGCAFRSGAKS
jgi:predicted metalloprotease with PDZ domain